MQFKKKYTTSALMVALFTTLVACGGDDNDEDNSGTAQSSATSSASSSATSSNDSSSASSSASSSSTSSSASSSSSSSAVTAKTCPDDYNAFTVSGNSSILNVTMTIRSKDKAAQITFRTPSTKTGDLKLCIGTPDGGLLPASGAGTRNYEIIGEGNYTALINPTLEIAYAAAGTYDVNYLGIPASAGQYGSYDSAGNLEVDRRVRAATQQNSSGTQFLSVDNIKPGLYMTTDVTQ
jgi:hypothetical protein